MNRHSVRVGLIAGAALLAQSVLAGPLAAQDATPAASPGAAATIEQVAVVTPSSRTNQGWDQQARLGATPAPQASGRFVAGSDRVALRP